MKMSSSFIFGYGSLICPSSRVLTGSLGPGVACKITGFSRSWSARVRDCTAVGVNADESGSVWGVVCRVEGNVPEEIKRFDAREAGYDRVRVQKEHISVFDGCVNPVGDDDEVFVYVGKTSALANEENPILQSYVDVIVKGCLETGGVEFARGFIETTRGFEGTWFNDRATPKYVRSETEWSEKNKDTVDSLLESCLGKDLFRSRRTM